VAHPREAAEAYQEASRYARMPFLQAGYLSDAARAWLAAGDTARAKGAYTEIITDLDSTTTAIEAKVRLGELTKGSN